MIKMAGLWDRKEKGTYRVEELTLKGTRWPG